MQKFYSKIFYCIISHINADDDGKK